MRIVWRVGFGTGELHGRTFGMDVVVDVVFGEGFLEFFLFCACGRDDVIRRIVFPFHYYRLTSDQWSNEISCYARARILV